MRPSEATRAEERREAKRPPGADREPTPEEAEIAEALELDPAVKAKYEEMAERGAQQQGEGRLP
jgi:hypothetical protein